MSTIETNRSWTHFRVHRRNPRYCHVTYDHPPINTITATTVAELSDLAGLVEKDPDLNVVVFDSANWDFSSRTPPVQIGDPLNLAYVRPVRAAGKRFKIRRC